MAFYIVNEGGASFCIEAVVPSKDEYLKKIVNLDAKMPGGSIHDFLSKRHLSVESQKRGRNEIS